MRLFDKVAAARTMSSDKYFVKMYYDEFKSGVINAYSTSYNNIANTYINISGVLI